MQNLQQARADYEASGGDITIRRYFGKDAHKILNGSGEHISDQRRHLKFLAETGRNMLDSFKNSDKDWDANAENAFNALTSLASCLEVKIYVDGLTIEDNISGAKKDAQIFGLGQKCAPEHRESKFDGLNLGTLMRGLAIGGKGNQHIQNALSEGTDSLGGYTVPVQILREFIDLMRNKSVLMKAGARTVLLETLKTSMATVTVDPVAAWRAENAAVATSDMTLGKVEFIPKSLAVNVVVSMELLQDSLNIEEILLNSLAQALALEVDRAGLYGTGASNQPLGLKSILVTATNTTSLGANGAKLSASGNYLPFVKEMRLIAQNGNDMANAIIMAPRTAYDLYGLTDTTDQPLMAPSVISDNITLLDTNSVPISLTQGSSNVASEAFIGNWTNLMLGMRSELRIELLRDKFASNLQISFIAHLRCDWQVARVNSFRLLQGILAE